MTPQVAQVAKFAKNSKKYRSKMTRTSYAQVPKGTVADIYIYIYIYIYGGVYFVPVNGTLNKVGPICGETCLL